MREGLRCGSGKLGEVKGEEGGVMLSLSFILRCEDIEGQGKQGKEEVEN